MFKPLSFDLAEVKELFLKRQVFDLRGLSNRLIREASIENNYGKAELGVISYALHKIETKQHFVNSPKWGEVKGMIVKHLESAIFAAKQQNERLLLDSLKGVVKGIVSIDDELGNYATSIYDKAKVKQASLAYSYGLSISQSADLTGADKKELQSYIGFTTMHDEEDEPMSITQRVSDLRKILGEK
jgi:hypothetical protein